MTTQTDEAGEVDRADHHKHMDYVQAVIARLGNNSFVMKGWALTLVSALLGFAVTRSDAALAAVAAIAALGFWVLDTYYLRQEKAFRAMFVDVAAKRVVGFEIQPTPYAKQQRWMKVGLSLSLSAFYGLLILVSLSLTAFLVVGNSGLHVEPVLPSETPATQAG